MMIAAVPVYVYAMYAIFIVGLVVAIWAQIRWGRKALRQKHRGTTDH